ncbi:MAG: GntR family transcriptional regulator [Pseudolabrys sp.]
MTDRLGEAKARQVYLVLRDRIVSGNLSHGRRLPNENELAAAHDVSRVTIRRALAELERECLIERRRSLGTRVIFQPSAAPIVGDITGMLASLADMGRRTTVKLLSFDYLPADGTVAEALGIKSPDLFQRAVRVRSIDGEPFSYLTTHVPERIGVTFTRQELASRPLLELLERSGVMVSRATQQIGAGLAVPEIAAALGVNAGSPLIEMTRVVYDAGGRVVEHLHALYRPDRYSLVIDLARSGRPNGKVWAPVVRAHRTRKRRSRSNTFESVVS